MNGGLSLSLSLSLVQKPSIEPLSPATVPLSVLQTEPDLSRCHSFVSFFFLDNMGKMVRHVRMF